MKDLFKQMPTYNELQATVVDFIEELEQHAKKYNQELYLDLVDLKNDVWSDEITPKNAILKASAMMDKKLFNTVIMKKK